MVKRKEIKDNDLQDTHRKLKIVQHEPHKKMGDPEG